MLGQTFPATRERPALSRSDERAETDPDLLRAGLAGDRAALTVLLRRHELSLYILCVGMLRHADDAEDAVQETFFRALRSLRRFRGDSSVRTWLFRIAVNVCLEWKRSRRPAAADAGQVEALPAECPQAAALDQLAVAEALQSLPALQRAVLLLKELEGCTAAEIALMLRWPQRRVYHELQKAHRALAEWRRRNLDEGAP
jgi:RNA polymerase sigma-70 factor (ECF subfamily)